MNSKCGTPTGRVSRTYVLFVLCLCLFSLFPSISLVYPLLIPGKGVFYTCEISKKLSWFVV